MHRFKLSDAIVAKVFRQILLAALLKLCNAADRFFARLSEVPSNRRELDAEEMDFRVTRLAE